jgi:hypothetical protein
MEKRYPGHKPVYRFYKFSGGLSGKDPLTYTSQVDPLLSRSSMHFMGDVSFTFSIW